MAGATSHDPIGTAAVDPAGLQAEVRAKYRDVALHPDSGFHFHTGRDLALRCRYDMAVVDALPPVTVESFAGVANPFELRPIPAGARVVDVGCGAGFDSFAAARAVGRSGRVIGLDMTPEMVAKAQINAQVLQLDNVEFREGLAESLPIDDGWADVVISNGVFNLCADKPAVFNEVMRVLRPGGALQFADIAHGRPVPAEALRHIDLWTG
jgi:arsenite methyltransferase